MPFHSWLNAYVLTSAQQVIDILREKISVMGTQLIESKQRVADLELRQAEDVARGERRSENLRDLGMIVPVVCGA